MGEQRADIIAEFRKPDSRIHGLIACEIFTKGFDCPDVMIGVSARPYKKSLSSHIQQLGRVMRAAPAKTFSVWLCHSGNSLRFKADVDDIFENGVSGIDDGKLEDKKRKEPSAAEEKACKCVCGYILNPNQTKSPACGKERKRQSLVEEQAGKMIELNSVTSKPLPKCLQDRTQVWKQLCGYATDRYGPGDKAKKWCLAKYRNWYNAWPSAEYQPSNYPISLDLKSKITSENIRFAKGKAKASKASA